jgi:hypothetical protein
MSTRAALTSGTGLSLAAVAVWAWSANLTIGPAPALHLSRNLRADYALLAAAPAGSGVALFAVIAVIFTLCLFVSGWRAQRSREDAG